MYQKTVEKEEGYSKKEFAKIKAVLKRIDRARKDPEVLKSARAFTKYHTGKKAAVGV